MNTDGEHPNLKLTQRYLMDPSGFQPLQGDDMTKTSSWDFLNVLDLSAYHCRERPTDQRSNKKGTRM